MIHLGHAIDFTVTLAIGLAILYWSDMLTDTSGLVCAFVIMLMRLPSLVKSIERHIK